MQSACCINSFLAACLSVTIIIFLIKFSIIHQCSYLDIALLHTYTPPGQDGSHWQVLSKWAPSCVCVCVWQVLTVQEPGRGQGQHLWVVSVCFVCAFKQYTTCAPLPCLRPADAVKVILAHTYIHTHLVMSIMPSYQSQLRSTVINIINYGAYIQLVL